MNKQFVSRIAMTSLTIFAMLFGAGNLMFPLRLGIECGSQTVWGFAGFVLTGVVLPLLGLLAIVSFSGDYTKFFGRIGKIPGFLMTLFCMMVIGPFVVLPRIVTLSYEMLQPFLPAMTPGVFAVFFLLLVLIATYRPGKLLDIIGKVLSPLKVASLALIVLIGVLTGGELATSVEPGWELFARGAQYGYLTLDLLGAIFFGSIVVNLLTLYADASERISTRDAVKITAISGVFAATLLAIIYAGMSYLGAAHGQELCHLNEGQIFSLITFKVLGSYGALLVGLTIFLACFTTTVSLTAVVADYVRRELFDEKISYSIALAMVLSICAVIARHGLSTILAVSIPVIVAVYPVIIMITVCNLAYALWGIKTIKVPVALATIATLLWTFKDYFIQL